MKLQGKSVLVTGGTGFIGGRLVEKLVREEHAEVRVLVRNFARVSRIARFPVHMVQGNLLDPATVNRAVDGCQVVFHCAYDFEGSAGDQMQVSVQGTKNVCDAVLRAKAAQMVHVSTFAVYSPAGSGDLDESSPWPRTNNTYVQAKRAAERLISKMQADKGLPAAVIQPTMVYGPYSPGWTIGTVHRLKTGLVPLLNKGTGYCNAVYVDDVADAIILAATNPAALGETFLVSAAEPVTWKAFYGAFERSIGIQATVDAPADELWQMVNQRAKRPGAFQRLFKLARRPDVFADLAALTMVSAPLRLLKKCLSEQQWVALKDRVGPGTGQANGSLPHPGRPLHVPDKNMMAHYESMIRVRIDKAKSLIGYSPRFDFDTGMDRTSRYIHWANLA